jgi:hypothetical protein
MATPIDIAPTDVPAPRFGPACTLCGAPPPLVSWQRRLTDAELADHHGVLDAQHEERLLLADPQLPPPVQSPLPPADDCTRIVHACYPHVITQDAAARIHQATCTAPDEADLPGCNCTPEPLPAPEPAPEQPAQPPGWGNGEE